ncbi:uncharacterized protein Hap1MRO34_008436 [Clarias gariepinus]|uniref:DUF4748 domain-containing protein n=1 Tax=Clarias gariepinus TaxID=13013 RepID=UPI00234CC61C|nr:DUF4748 domain-containing protein [Clarias gariepinus]
MAAPSWSLLRSSVKGLHLCLKTAHGHSSSFSSRRCVLQHRALHLSTSRFLNPNKTNAAETPDPAKNPQDNREEKAEQEGEEDPGPEYIPKRKAKNPMRAIGYAWIIGFPSGIIGFILAKRQVDKNRLEQLRIRQRMKKSNEGEYERERYRPAAGMQ